MSIKAKLLTAVIVGSMITIGGISASHTVNYNTQQAKANNVSLLVAPSAKVGQVNGLENQSLTIAPVNGKVLNNVPATITMNGKTIFSGDIYNGKINLNNYYQFGELVNGLNEEGFHNMTLKVKGYEPVVVTLYSRKMYSMVEMYGLNPNTKVDALINGKVQNFTADNRGSLYLYSYKPFTFAPANMNDNFGRQYQMESWQYSVTPFYAVESAPVNLKKEIVKVPLTVGQTQGLEPQFLPIAPVDGKVLNNVPATITQDGKVIYSGSVSNGKIDINNYYNFGQLIGDNNSEGWHNVTLNVQGYKPMTVTFYARKMYSMVEMYGLNPNTKVDALINGKVQNFTADNRGSLYLYSYKPFTFAPANMNDNFGRQYQMESWQYSVTPFYAVESAPIYLSR